MTTHSESSQLLAVAEAAAAEVTPMLLAAFRTAMTVTTKRDAHDIVTAHGGEIAILDAPIGGARVLVTLDRAGPQRGRTDLSRSQTTV